MVNLTYGVLSENADGTYTLNPLGTDLIATYNGEPAGKRLVLAFHLDTRSDPLLSV
jgi:hypothetical protein